MGVFLNSHTRPVNRAYSQSGLEQALPATTEWPVMQTQLKRIFCNFIRGNDFTGMFSPFL